MIHYEFISSIKMVTVNIDNNKVVPTEFSKIQAQYVWGNIEDNLHINNKNIHIHACIDIDEIAEKNPQATFDEVPIYWSCNSEQNENIIKQYINNWLNEINHTLDNSYLYNDSNYKRFIETDHNILTICVMPYEEYCQEYIEEDLMNVYL